LTTDSSIKLKLSIWRNFVPNSSLVFRAAAGQQGHVMVGDTHLQEEIYTWHLKEDAFGGVTDEGIRAELQQLLVDTFSASHAPEQRRFAVLDEFLQKADAAIEAKHAEWTVCQDAPVDDEDIPYRINSLLALKLHLQWLANCFAGQPGISVSIR
jgi:hypothetical protein